MALMRNQPAALRRRVTTWSLAADVVVALAIGFFIGSLIGWIVFVIGLIVTGLLYYNISQVMRTRGYR